MKRKIAILLFSIVLFSCSEKEKQKISYLEFQLRESINQKKVLIKQVDSLKKLPLKDSKCSDKHNEYVKKFIENDTVTFNNIKIIQVGSFHKEEIDTLISRRKWFGLFKDSLNYYLKQVDITIETVYDPIVDINENKSSGKKVSINGTLKPIILIKGIKKLKEGNISHLALKKTKIFPGEILNLDFNERYYTFIGNGTANHLEYGLRDYYLNLSDNNNSLQTLAATEQFEDNMFKLIWCGDIDRDGKLDFIFNLSNQYNGMNTTLFLSSYARGNEIVRKVAEFSTVGC